jgi:FkbM family methyltransferase
MNIIDQREKTCQEAEKFLINLNQDVFIIGRNKYSSSLIKYFSSLNKNVIGFIDDFTDLEFYDNLPIYKSNRNYTQNAIINCIVEGRTIDVESLIISLEPKCHIDYFALQFTFYNDLTPVDFLINTNSILNNIDAYSEIFNTLLDDQSKSEFTALTNFRLNRDICFLKSFKFNLKGQYFEEFIKLSDNVSFIDGGGFDGSSSLEFIKLHPNYKKIYYFEPSSKSMEQSKFNLSMECKVEYYQKGLWSSETILHFDNSRGSASSFSNTGTESIQTITIDNIVEDAVDFIKLDIEGAETEALIGAKNVISKFKPKLAICVYHKQNHFLEIPQLVLNLNPNYQVILRHYTQGVFETVMYFI